MATEIAMLEEELRDQFVFRVNGDNPYYHPFHTSMFDILTYHANYGNWKPSFSEVVDGMRRYYFWREVP